VDRDLSFGRLLKRLRKARDLTQEALAQQAYCAVDTIKKIEQGLRRPSRQLAEQFADCLALSGDERVAFLGAARAVAGEEAVATTGTAAAQRQAAFPRQPPPLVGRAAELATLDALLADPLTRLVTITGPGGMGKTRLAIALAEQLLTSERFLDGVCFVPLAPLDTAERIVPALAEALAFPLDAGKQPARSPRQQVFDYLRARRLLLILDNLEHLLGGAEAGDGSTADMVAALLANAPGVAILATSRERLRLREEHVYPLGGLDVPDSLAPASSSAVTLFVQCATQLRPAFTPARDQLDGVARICRLVDGMPLAIELAAGWIDTLAPSEIAAAIERDLDLLATELHDVPARHRSMRVVFDASYQRLSASEQRLFNRLAIFRGGGILEAVQAVTRATLLQLQALIGASLLSYDAARGRYTLHELLRQYATEKLGAEREDELWVREQHAAYYCTFVQQRGAELSGFDQRAALEALDAERDNVRTAWAWAAKRGRVDLLARALDGLGYFNEWRGAIDDGKRAYQSAAVALEAQPAEDEAIRVLAMLRAWQGAFTRLQGDVVEAEQLLRQSLVLLERTTSAYDTRAERAFVLLQLGLAASEGRLDDAHRFFEESLALYQALDRRWETSQVLLWLGDLCRYQGAFEQARQHFRASLSIRTALGDRRGAAEVLIWDGHAAAELGQIDEAELLARRSRALHAELGGRANDVLGQGELGVMLIWAGKYDEACRELRQSLELYEDLGNHAMHIYVQGWLAVALLGIGHYEVAGALSRQATAQARELRGVQSGLAFMLHYAGWVALTLKAYSEAEALLQESVELHQQTGNAGHGSWPLAQLGYTHWLLGGTRRAQAELLDVIVISLKQRAFTPLLLALPAIALILAEQGQTERAVELYALAWRYPLLANGQGFIDSFGQRLDAVVAALPPAVAAAAQARGRLLDLWESAGVLLAELRAGGWGSLADEQQPSRLGSPSW
jgi:predicted ATPase/DNA-binding XRE family transcriptional regulator